MFKPLLKAATALGAFCAWTAQATLVHLEGGTVDFYYDNAQPDMAIYGALASTGDSIWATPDNFIAEATNGGSASAWGAGTVTVVVKPGYRFSSVAIGLLGDYGGTSGSSVGVDATFTVEQSGGSAIDSVTMGGSGGGTFDGLTREWELMETIDLGTAQWTGVTSLDLSLDTLLTAQASSAGWALIALKGAGAGFIIETVPVPLPAGIWLFLSGAALLGSRLLKGREA
ncbi:MAG TPA: hypothetical protein ENJ05_10810 [Thiotrichales bacterium]|nr:hypothetical protein [Thiotrichales bacterium]